MMAHKSMNVSTCPHFPNIVFSRAYRLAGQVWREVVMPSVGPDVRHSASEMWANVTSGVQRHASLVD